MDIFGYSFEEISSMQQRTFKSKTIDTSIPSDDITKYAVSDKEALEKYGLDGLKEKGFFGIIDRLTRSNII